LTKHTILFLTANPLGTDRLALDREARAIQVELERSGYRDRFELVTRWAVEPIDLLRELRTLRPTVVHFSGHGQKAAATTRSDGPAQQYMDDGTGQPIQAAAGGLYFQAADGRARLVPASAIEQTFGAAGSSVRLVVLNACYSAAQAEALLAHVDCVVGMSGAIRDDAARFFAVGFYGGIAEQESVAGAFKQACAAISLEGLRNGEQPQLIKVREGIDASKLILAIQTNNVVHGNETLLSIHFESFDSGLQDVLALAAAEAQKNNKSRISTRHLFSAIVRLQPGHMPELMRWIRRIAPRALPEPIDENIEPNRRLLWKPFPISSCIEDSLENLTPKVTSHRRLGSEDLFVDIARYGTGPSIRRLRTHGIDRESIHRIVHQLGWHIIERD
jgi:hypothetical protein